MTGAAEAPPRRPGRARGPRPAGFGAAAPGGLARRGCVAPRAPRIIWQMEYQRFASDISLPGMLHALTIRSPIAKGRLSAVERPELPEGCALITARDIPGKNALLGSALPILAARELSYIGEPVALLLGPDRGELERLAEGCRVAAEEGEPVFSAAEAAAIAEAEPKAGQALIAARRSIRRGRPEEAFAAAASIVRGEFETGIQEHWYSEPCGAVAWIEGGEEGEGGQGRAGPRIAVSAATQWPSHAGRAVAQALGIGAGEVLVLPRDAGAHLDGKLWYPSLLSCHAALCAKISGRPARLMLSKKEDFLFSPKRFGASVKIASAFDENGELAAVDIEAALSAGAHGVGAAEMLDQLCLGSMGLYAAKSVSVRGAAFKTNIPPQGPFAGFGLAQGFFAMERHASIIADERRQDPAQMRAESLIRGKALPPGLPLREAVPGERLIGAAQGMSDYRRKWASYELLRRKGKGQPPGDAQRGHSGEALRGIGIALGCQGSGFLRPAAGLMGKGAPAGGEAGAEAACAVELILEKDGSLEIRAGMPGAGQDAAWAAIALEVLGVEAGSVRISRGEGAPDSGPATMSRKATVLTELVEQACIAIRGLRFRDPLPISVSRAAHIEEDPEWSKAFPSPRGGGADCSGFLRPGAAAAVVEVEIDPAEHVPRLRGIWLAVDGGRVFSEDKARRSLRLSAAQALGWAFREQARYISGRIPEGAFEAFEIPGASEIPPIAIEFLEDSSGHPKGVGDLPFSCIPAAYLQAASQAADWPFRSLPLRAQDVWYAGVARRGDGGGGGAVTAGFILNGEDVAFRGSPGARLIDILRGEFGLSGAKACCLAGKCGLCSVIFNGSVSHACLIPAFRLGGSEVITIEGFSLTDEYQDIEAGFAEAQVESCGYCRNGKALAAGALLGRSKRPSREDILRAADGIKCRCTDPELLAEGIERALEARLRRLYGRSA